jgi:hypothetical protein
MRNSEGITKAQVGRMRFNFNHEECEPRKVDCIS